VGWSYRGPREIAHLIRGGMQSDHDKRDFVGCSTPGGSYIRFSTTAVQACARLVRL